MTKILVAIVILALFVRFLFFPNNTYFGYDQARDAFAALEIADGKLKLIGPTTSFEGLNHGVFYYYLITPFYLLGGGSPEFTAAGLRVLNSLGVLVVFFLGLALFNRFVGIIAALFFAVSFEQTQFAIYMGNPAPASLTITLMYLGLALAFFKKRYWGLPLAAFFLGLSIQLQFALLYLIAPFLIITILNFKTFIQFSIRWVVLSLGAFVLSISTFLIAELKFNFRTVNSILSLSNFNPDKTIFTIVNSYLFTISRMLTFNLTDGFLTNSFVMFILLVSLVYVYYKYKNFRKQLLFLSIWFFSLLIPTFVHGGANDLQKDVPLFYPNVGVSVSLLIFVSMIVYLLKDRWRIISAALVVFIIIANLKTITLLNPKGTISEINVQQGMLLAQQKKVLDLLYQNANGQPFTVKAITMPFYINTTWSYLFKWYGKNKYGYLPVWNGKNALGYPGNLEVVEAQEKLPIKRYLIIEPTRGIYQYMIDEYLKEENYFTINLQEHKIGEFIVQKRVKY